MLPVSGFLQRRGCFLLSASATPTGPPAFASPQIAAVTSAAIQRASGSCSGLFGEGRIHRATK
jgi:hypothetical protein